ncbi:MAG: AMP-binding protein [Moheibacter sp.]
MMLLDFSKEIDFPKNADEDWQKEILGFLTEWFSEKDFIVSQTSGSTGTPKEIRIPKYAMKMSAQMTGEFFGLQKGDTALLCMPVNFIAGRMMVVRAIELKLKLFCVQPKSKMVLEKFPTLDFVPMTPMQAEASLADLGKIRILLLGGAPLSDGLRKNLSALETKCFESYGMTETITHIALKEISEACFTVLPKIKIRQDNRGCLVIRTPYFTEEILTNDLVEIHRENQFKWLGRFDNVINSGGIKLFPEQIEAKIKPFLQNEFIIGSLPDEKLGQRLVLVIESENQMNLDLGKFTEVLGKFECPKEIYFVKTFPRTESGKVQRTKILKSLNRPNL